MTVTISSPNWWLHAACRNVPIDLFFPGEGYRGKYEEAAPICARCPVAHPCLEWALAYEFHGYWGGTSERQRIRIRKDREHLKALARSSLAV